MAKIIVTGGAGFIGYHLVKRLLEQGKEVHVIDNVSKGNYGDKAFKELLEKYPNTLTATYWDLADTATALKEADQIYHLASAVSGKGLKGNPLELVRSNYSIMDNLIKSLAENDKTKVVFSSTSEVNVGLPDVLRGMPTSEVAAVGWLDPFNPRWAYSISKFVNEVQLNLAAPTAKFRYSIVRLGNVYGPRMMHDYVVKSLITKALQDVNPYIVHTPRDTRSFAFVEDIAEGLQKVMETEASDFETFNLANYETSTIQNLAELVRQISGKDYKILYALNEGEEHRMPDTRKAKSLLNWSANTTLFDGLKKTYDWYKENFV